MIRMLVMMLAAIALSACAGSTTAAAIGGSLALVAAKPLACRSAASVCEYVQRTWCDPEDGGGLFGEVPAASSQPITIAGSSSSSSTSGGEAAPPDPDVLEPELEPAIEP
jgi:hypothetical protein